MKRHPIVPLSAYDRIGYECPVCNTEYVGAHSCQSATRVVVDCKGLRTKPKNQTRFASLRGVHAAARETKTIMTYVAAVVRR